MDTSPGRAVVHIHEGGTSAGNTVEGRPNDQNRKGSGAKKKRLSQSPCLGDGPSYLPKHGRLGAKSLQKLPSSTASWYPQVVYDWIVLVRKHLYSRGILREVRLHLIA